MTAPVALLALAEVFVNGFTKPGFRHFRHFLAAHAAMWGAPHNVAETLRQTRWHDCKHWTAPYAFMKKGRFSCGFMARRLRDLLLERLPFGEELVLVVDDTLVKKWGGRFFGLGRYPDPTDKNPGASRRRVLGHCWVVLAMLLEQGPGQWFCFPLAAWLFVPRAACERESHPFRTKIALAAGLLRSLLIEGRRAILLADNLYAKAEILADGLGEGDALVSRLRSNAALNDPLPARRKKQRGRPPKRGRKVTAQQLFRRRSKRRDLAVRIYGKQVSIRAFVGVVTSRALGDRAILAVIFPQRSGKRLNIFFSTDTQMSAERLLELYAARFKIEDAFDELKTHGGFGDCRQRGFTALRRHAQLTLLAHSLLRLLALSLPGASSLAAEPWWRPAGPPSVTRMRRAVSQGFAISRALHGALKLVKIPRDKQPALATHDRQPKLAA